jgi:SAM-dependent methyltransferase
VASIYTDGTYLRQNPNWHQDDSAWKAGHIQALLARNGITEPGSICEVGCGAGEVLRVMSQRFPAATQFVGYDISPMAYAISQQKAGGNLSYKLGDVFDDSVTFDVVMAIDVFEHVEDYFSFLRRLREKGKFKVFHIPLELTVQNVLRGRPLLDARRSVGHIHHFSTETAIAALEDTGYQVVDHFYTSGRTELPGLGWKSKMLKWPRRMVYRVSPSTAVRVLGGYSLMVLAR